MYLYVYVRVSKNKFTLDRFSLCVALKRCVLFCLDHFLHVVFDQSSIFFGIESVRFCCCVQIELERILQLSWFLWDFFMPQNDVVKCGVFFGDYKDGSEQ